jgi:DNA polymerase/3'-5' exonuclease PolX
LPPPLTPAQANNSICAMFSELAKLERLAGGEHAGFKASSWKKAALAIAGLDFEVTDAKVLTAAKTKVANIGKGSAGVIDEFLQSGKTGLVKLEELRAKVHGG